MFSSVQSILRRAVLLAGMLATSNATIAKMVMDQERFVVFNSRQLTGECGKETNVVVVYGASIYETRKASKAYFLPFFSDNLRRSKCPTFGGSDYDVCTKRQSDFFTI